MNDPTRRASNRSTKRHANRNRGGGGGNPLALACMLFRCLLVNFFAELLELLASGATMMAAVTGEDFVSAARHVTGLLRRHACSTLVVWYVPGYLLGLVSFMLARRGGRGRILFSSTAVLVVWSIHTHRSFGRLVHSSNNQQRAFKECTRFDSSIFKCFLSSYSSRIFSL